MFIGNSYVDNVKTKDLVQLGQSLQHMAAGHVTFVTVPTGVTDQNGDEPPRTADMKALFDGHHQRRSATAGKRPERTEFGDLRNLGADNRAHAPRSHRRLARLREAHREQVTTTSPQDVTVQVSNATGADRSGRHRHQPAQAQRLQRDDAG